MSEPRILPDTIPIFPLTGVLLLGVLQNVLTLSQVPTFWIDAVYGAIILLALIFARLTGDRAEDA